MEHVPYREITIETVDRAIKDWFDKTLNIRVKTTDGSMRKVPVNFSQGERWMIGRTKQEFRDENGILILPIIAVRRTGIEPDLTRMSLGVQTEYIKVAKMIDTKTNDLQGLEARKPGEVSRAYPPVYDVYTIPYPDRIIASYQLVVQTQYITQMNEIMQKIWRELDIQNSFVAPYDNDGRHAPMMNQFGMANPYEPTKDLPNGYVVGFLESGYADSGNFEDYTETERIVKYTTDIQVPCVLQTIPEGEKHPLKIQRTAYKVTLKDENVTLVDDPAILDEIFGPLK